MTTPSTALIHQIYAHRGIREIAELAYGDLEEAKARAHLLDTRLQKTLDGGQFPNVNDAVRTMKKIIRRLVTLSSNTALNKDLKAEVQQLHISLDLVYGIFRLLPKVDDANKSVIESMKPYQEFADRVDGTLRTHSCATNNGSSPDSASDVKTDNEPIRVQSLEQEQLGQQEDDDSMIPDMFSRSRNDGSDQEEAPEQQVNVARSPSSSSSLGLSNLSGLHSSNINTEDKKKQRPSLTEEFKSLLDVLSKRRRESSLPATKKRIKTEPAAQDHPDEDTMLSPEVTTGPLPDLDLDFDLFDDEEAWDDL